MTLANQPTPASRGDRQPPQVNPLSQLQKLDRSWTLTIAACVLLELSTFGMDNPLINGIRWINRAAIVSVGSFKYCRYRLSEDIRAEIENEMRSQRVEASSNAQRYRYEIENLKGTNNALSQEIQTLTVELERRKDADLNSYSLNKTIVALQKQLDLKHSEILDMQSALHNISRQNAVIKKHTVEFTTAAQAVIIDLIQNSLLQKKQSNDQAAQLTDQSATLQRLYEGYQQALKTNQENIELMREQQIEHKEITHDLRLKIRELQTEVRVSKKQNRFADDDE